MANLLDVLDNADGSNTLYYDDGSVVVVSADGTLISSNLSSSFFYGTQSDDNLIGTKGADIMYGLAGSDLINAKDGNDLINGGSGSDTILGGDGADTFIHDVHENFNNTGIDFINAGKDTDKLVLDLSDVTLSELSAMGFNINVADPSTVYADFRAQLLAYFNSQIAADPNVTVDFSSLHINLQVKGVEILVVKTPPDARASSLNMDEDHVGNGAFDYSDPDGDIPKVVKINDADITVGTPYTFTSGDLMGATITVNANGTYALNLNGLFNSLSASETVTTTFTFTVIDDDGAMDTAIATVVIQGLNDGGVISGQLTGQVQEDLSLTASGVATIADADAHDAPSFVAGTFAGQHGSLQLDANGTWTYTLNNAAAQSLSGTDIISDTIQIQAQSGTELLTHDLVISIAGNNDAATISGNVQNLSEEGGQISGTAQINDVDTNDVKTFVAITTPVAGQYGSLTMDAQGHWVYTLNPLLKDSLNQGQNVTESFAIQAQSGPDTINDFVTINLTGQNDAPTAGAISLSTDENTIVGDNLRIFADDADAENDATNLVYNITQPTKGSVTLDANGNFTFNPGTDFTSLNDGQTELVNFTYTVTDARNVTTTGAITITVNGITNVNQSLWTEGGDGSIVVVDGVVQQINYVDMNSIVLSQYSGNSYDSLGGNDVIKLPDQANFATTGFNPATVFNAGAGADLLVAGIANATVTYNVNLGTGNDEIHLQAGGHVLDGGADTDTVAFDLYQSTNQSGVNVKLTLQTSLNTVVASNLGTTFLSAIMANFENVIGSNYNDTITGDGGNNILVGLAGNDNIGGDAGNDVIYGNAGTNTLSGDAGNDLVMITNISVDTINGGADRDAVSYAQFKPGSTYSAAVQIVAGATAGSYNVTSLDAGLTSAMVHQTIANVEQIVGSTASDTYAVAAGTASDYFDGNDGADTVSFANSTAGVTLDFGNTGQQNTGGSGLDTYLNIEHVTGSAFNDVFISANDLVNNIYNGGSGGMDTVSYANVGGPVTVDLGTSLTNGTATGAGNDSLIRIDKVIGTRFNDSLTGLSVVASAVNTLMGGDGNDTLIGGAGINISNFLYGESGNDSITVKGNDTVDGGSGNDTIKIEFQPIFITNSISTTVTVNGGTGFDLLDFSLGVASGNSLAGGITFDWSINSQTIQTSEFANGNQSIFLTVSNIEGVIGSAKNDTFIMNGIGALPYARVDGGAGSDTVDYSGILDPSAALSVRGVTLDLNNQGIQKTMPYAAAGHYESIQNVENVIGTSGIDFIVASNANNSLIGGLGSDTVSYLKATSAVFINLASTVAYNTYGSGMDYLSGFQRVIGSNYGDVILGPSAFEDATLAGRIHVYDGGGGNDTLIGHSGTGTPFDIALLNDNIMYYRFVQSTQGLLAINNWTGEADTLVYMDGVMAPADQIGNRVPTYQIISATPFVADSDAPTDTVGINSSNPLQLTANFDTNFNPFYANGALNLGSYAAQIGMISFNSTTGQLDYFAPVTGSDFSNIIVNTITPNKLYVGYNNAEGLVTKNVFHDNGAGLHDVYMGTIGITNEVAYSNHLAQDLTSLSSIQLQGGISYFVLSFSNGETDYFQNIQRVTFNGGSLDINASSVNTTQLFTSGSNIVNFNVISQTLWEGTVNPYDALAGSDVITLPNQVALSGWDISDVWNNGELFRAGEGDDSIIDGNYADFVSGDAGIDTWNMTSFTAAITVDWKPVRIDLGDYQGIGTQVGADRIIDFEKIQVGSVSYNFLTNYETDLQYSYATASNNILADLGLIQESSTGSIGLLLGTANKDWMIIDESNPAYVRADGGDDVIFTHINGNIIFGEGGVDTVVLQGPASAYHFTGLENDVKIQLLSNGNADMINGIEQVALGGVIYSLGTPSNDDLAVEVTNGSVYSGGPWLIATRDLDLNVNTNPPGTVIVRTDASVVQNEVTKYSYLSTDNANDIVYGGNIVASDDKVGGDALSSLDHNASGTNFTSLYVDDVVLPRAGLNAGNAASLVYTIETNGGNDTIVAGSVAGGKENNISGKIGYDSDGNVYAGGLSGAAGGATYVINAGEGNDTIFLNESIRNGAYQVNLGNGQDVLHITSSSTTVTVQDFNAVEDTLNLSALHLTVLDAQALIDNQGTLGNINITMNNFDWSQAQLGSNVLFL